MVGQAYPEENTVECHYTNTLVQSAREAEKRTPQTGVEMESSCGTEGCWIILGSRDQENWRTAVEALCFMRSREE
uniref:Uncharacterized protein n=1 Tax=Arion vulgaris TaxID=1028688 RepID=A0A0B7A2S5_9EUPU